MASLADIRKRLAAQENKGSSTGDQAIYPHWNITEDDQATLRFIDDGDVNNPYFWVERNMFKFPFNGIKGSTEHSIQETDKVTIVQVPCMEMYNEKCPVLDEVRTWFKDASLEDMGKKFWKKRSYLFQGFVRQNPLTGETAPENPIRRFIISPQIFTLIKNSLMDPEIENLPTDVDLGLDFRVNKTEKGGYADYSTSSWARKETALTEDERAALEKYGSFKLTDFLPKKPDEATLKIIVEMFEAAVDGEPYDIERWGMYYTPQGVSRIKKNSANQTESTKPKEEAGDTPSSVATPKATKVDTPPVVENATDATDATDATEEASSTPADAENVKANDILAMIRSRQQ